MSSELECYSSARGPTEQVGARNRSIDCAKEKHATKLSDAKALSGIFALALGSEWLPGYLELASSFLLYHASAK